MKIEESESDSVEASVNGSFVIVRVPIQVLGEVPKGGVTVRYGIGSFTGRESDLPIQNGALTKLTFRVPKELFRPRQHLKLEVVVRDDEGAPMILWTKRYEASWTGSAPRMGPVDELLGEEPERKR